MNELIDALRNCIGMYPDASCDKCPYDKHPRCSIDMMSDAADAIERLIEEIDRKDNALQAWANTWESKRDMLIQNICQHCDTTPEEKLKDGYCEGCPIVGEVKAVFDDETERS